MPTVAIIGRPNAGKSTLFNALLGERRAIESDTPGTTRDRVFGTVKGERYDFLLVDTGGLTTEVSDDIEQNMRAQAEESIAGADVIYFCIDIREPLTAEEETIAEILRKKKPKNIPVFVIATKAEKPSAEESAGDLYGLGVSDRDIFFVSAKEHKGLFELLEATEAEFERRSFPIKNSQEGEEENKITRIALVGRPNAGKSTLLNTLSGKDISIVSEKAGTTRDNIDSIVRFEKEEYLLIDTAGIRKKSRMNEEQIERFSRLRTLSALNRADIAILLIDAREGISHQDQTLADAIVEAGCGVMVVFSKWDLVREQGRSEVESEQESKALMRPDAMDDEEELEKKISKNVSSLRSYLLRQAQSKLPFLNWAPVLFLSAIEKRGIHDIFKTVREIMHERQRSIKTSELNDFLEHALNLHPPASRGKIQLKVKYVTQTGTNPPVFSFFVNDPDAVHFSFRRFLENRLREVYGFWGTPIRLDMRAKGGGRRGKQ